MSSATSDKYTVKGTTLVNQRAFLNERIRPGYLEEKMKEINPSFKSVILPSTMYSAYDCLMLTQVAAKDLGMTLQEICYAQNEYNLHQSLTTMYKFFLKLGGPIVVLSKLPQMVKTFTNSVVFETEKNEKGEYEGEIASPQIFAEWNKFMVMGGLLGVIKALDRKIVRLESSSPTEYDGPDGTWVKYHIYFNYE